MQSTQASVLILAQHPRAKPGVPGHRPARAAGGRRPPRRHRYTSASRAI